MATKIYVGGLSYDINDDKLKELFSEFGDVESAIVIMDRDSGRSKGFGFVEMTDEGAKKAIENMHDKDVDGRKLTVNLARPRVERR